MLNFSVSLYMSERKRKYIKRSDYWDKFKKHEKSLEDLASELTDEAWAPQLVGEAYYSSESKAYSRKGSGGNASLDGRTNTRANRAALTRTPFKYNNIWEGGLPYKYSKGGDVDIREAILLCQKAYANIPIFRNVIDIMAEFANTEFVLEGGTKKSRDFVDKWMQSIKIWNLKDQFFREYYRSGNVFLYRLDSKFDEKDFAKFNTIYGGKFLKPNQIPIKYVVLNPYDIIAVRATSIHMELIYRKVLSEFELARLKNPQTPYDVEVLNSFPPETRKRIKEGEFGLSGVLMELDPDKLVYSFYKKQDYEPFAVPFGFAVLDDLNWKIELKKVDQAICRTIENVILLITMGNTPDKGGINPHNLTAMQQLFGNESIGRVLVSDYTTKADFVIPDLNKVLGPDKYTVVNEDIKEALQNVVVGHERYSNTQVKAQIFLERLKEARNAFLNDFLQPQIKLVCKNLGFRKYPTARFQEIDLKDEVQLQRVTTRLMELGIITPEEGLRTIKTGIYPHVDDIMHDQEKFLHDREKGYYMPLIGGAPFIAPDDEEEGMKGQPTKTNQPEDKTPQVQDVVDDEGIEPITGPVTVGFPYRGKKIKPEHGRPTGTKKSGGPAFGSVTPNEIEQAVKSTEDLFKFAEKETRSQLNIKRLSKSKKSLIEELCKSVIVSHDADKWEEVVTQCISDNTLISNLNTLPEILEVASEMDLEPYAASLLYHGKISKKNSPEAEKGV